MDMGALLRTILGTETTSGTPRSTLEGPLITLKLTVAQ